MTDGERIEETIKTVRRWRAEMGEHARRLAELAFNPIDCTIGRATTLDRELDALNSRLAQEHGYKLVEHTDGTISLRKSETTIGMTLRDLNINSANQNVSFSAAGDGFDVDGFSLSMKIDTTAALRDIERGAKHKVAGILEKMAADMRRLADAD